MLQTKNLKKVKKIRMEIQLLVFWTDKLTNILKERSKLLSQKKFKTIQQKELKLERTTEKSTYNRSSFRIISRGCMCRMHVLRLQRIGNHKRAIFVILCLIERTRTSNAFLEKSLLQSATCNRNATSTRGGFNYNL